MMMLKALLLTLVASASATCGTTCGGCTATDCSGLFTCTDCGQEPCVDTDLNCWSCCGSDNHCYPYDCGTVCSTAPCASVEAAANSFPKKGVSGEVKFAKALAYGHQKALPVNMTPKGARTQKATMLEK